MLDLADIKGQKVNLVELSVSHYLLARGLSTVKLHEKDIKTVNTSDADIVAAAKSADTTAVVTWNPQLMEVKAEPNTTEVFNSSKIPGEIQDLLVIKTETLKDNPDLGKALVGIWYETIALMQALEAWPARLSRPIAAARSSRSTRMIRRCSRTWSWPPRCSSAG